jgi:D-arabinose 1-dehydrogenase-like Zn-dependent alcohol dehydrogenase
MPQGASWKNAVCYDPAQFAMSGVRDANVRVGDFVVVVGLGAIGQIAIQLAKKPVRQWSSASILSNTAVRSPVVMAQTTV